MNNRTFAASQSYSGRVGRSPAAEISSATASTLARVRPARKRCAPSRAQARETEPPTEPPLRRLRRSCSQATFSSSPLCRVVSCARCGAARLIARLLLVGYTPWRDVPFERPEDEASSCLDQIVAL